MLESRMQAMAPYCCSYSSFYFYAMKRLLLLTMGLSLWPANSLFAQFNTVTQDKVRQHKMMALQHDTSAEKPSHSIYQCQDSLAANFRHDKTEQTDRLPALVSPLRQIFVTSPFGWRIDPFTKRKARHSGLDLRAYYEPAYAMMHGEVICVGKDKRSGLYVTIRHGDFTVSYCHLSKVTVTIGTLVVPGTIVAITGNSGRSTAPHLHLSVKKDDRHIDPAILLNFIRQTAIQGMFADNNGPIEG